MTTQLSTDVKTHVIITRTDLHVYINQKQYDRIMELSNDGHTRGIPLKTDNGKETFVSFGDIASMPDMETYYTSFPDRRPDPIEMVKQIFGGEVVEDKRSKKSLRQHAEEYLAAHPNEDSPATRFMKTQLTRLKTIGGGRDKQVYEPKYKSWQDRYYDKPLELLENRTKDQIVEFLKDAPPDQLAKMHDTMIKEVEKHDPCSCPDVGLCRPAGLLAVIIKAMQPKVEKKPAGKTVAKKK